MMINLKTWQPKKSPAGFGSEDPTPKNFSSSAVILDRIVDAPKTNLNSAKVNRVTPKPKSKQKPNHDPLPSSGKVDTRRTPDSILPPRTPPAPPDPPEVVLETEVVPGDITQVNVLPAKVDETKGAPKPATKWVENPDWTPRKRTPGKRGWRNNREELEAIDQAVRSVLPDDLLAEYRAKWDTCDEADREEVLCALASQGYSMQVMAKQLGVNWHTIHFFLTNHRAALARVQEVRRTVGADALAEEALRVATTPSMTKERIDVYDKEGQLINSTVKTADNVYARKLAFQARMRLLEIWSPERYGPNAKPDVGDAIAEKIRKAKERIAPNMKPMRRPEADKAAKEAKDSGGDKQAQV